jgi:hypothetical protein
MSGIDVVWHYLAKASVAGNRRQWLGQSLRTIQFASDLSARTRFLPGTTTLVREIVKQMDADLY